MVGQRYEVLFDHSILSGTSASSFGARDYTLRVSATGNATQDYTLTSDGSVTSSIATWNTLPYVSQEYWFTATSTSTMLTFANQTVYGGNGNFGTTIDNIIVNAVPEPSTFVLLLFGALSMWLFCGGTRSKRKVKLTRA